MTHLVKNLPSVWETWVQSLDWEDPLEKGKGYPLQHSGLENSRDYTVHGVTKRRTQLSGSLFSSLSCTGSDVGISPLTGCPLLWPWFHVCLYPSATQPLA